MFISKKLNKSGSYSIVIVEKINGKNREVHRIGTAKIEDDIEDLMQKARSWMHDYKYGNSDLFSESKEIVQSRETAEMERFLSNIDSILLNGVGLIFDKVYTRIGFDKIDDEVLKQLVISRICQPSSKSGTVDYLLHYFDEDVNLSKIYRYLDKLNNTQKDIVQQISITHTKRILGGRIGVVFYDVTTLYFESDKGDALRKTGFSKDGKHSNPQVVLGLLVSKGGYPLAYSIHEGNKYEGHTILPIVEDFVKKFCLKDFVIVADAGLMNKANLTEMRQRGYNYIIGAKIKSESNEVKDWILSQKKVDGRFYEIKKADKNRLIIGYSDARAKKDRYNREKGVRRLENDYQSGKLSKDSINKRGYNKFLEIEKDVHVKINTTKIAEDERWDGLKGYISNTKISCKSIYERYRDLWQIERAFRVTKGKLEMRPMFHFTSKRIEAHICICFVAYKCYKELERMMKINKMDISIDKALFIAGSVTTIRVRMPKSNEIFEKTMLFKKHQAIEKLFSENFWVA
jgi:transposase